MITEGNEHLGTHTMYTQGQVLINYLFLIGKPKMVLHDHISMQYLLKWQNTTPDYIIFYNDRPFSWMGGFPLPLISNGDTRVFMATHLASNARYIIHLWRTMTENNCSKCIMLPYTIKDSIDNLEEIKSQGFNIRRILSGGQMVDGADKLIGVCCDEFLIGYAQTEFNATSVNYNPNAERGDIGLPFPGVEIRIVDDTNHVLLRNNIGSIQVRGHPACKGYLNNPSMSKALFAEGGWLRSGDIGTITHEGRLVIKGREKDIISRGTRKIIPGFIEDVVCAMEGVKMVVVVGVPDRRLGEEVCLCFIPEETAHISVEDMKSFCQEKFVKTEAIDGFGDMPSFFLKFEEFPKLPNGKMDKKKLQQTAAGMLDLGDL